MEYWELQQMQGLDLEVKVLKTKQRIKEWYEAHDGNVYVSFSGGKDSTVLLMIAREMYPDIPAVFIDTGLEYPEVRDFVKTWDNVVTLRPKMGFKEVIEKYGYPVISKEQAQYIASVRNCKDKTGKTYNQRMNGNRWGRGKVSEKWKFLIDAPFKISDKCCDVMKKKPAKDYEKATGNHPIIGVMACESSKRVQDYLKVGCNAFDAKRPMSRPMGFWTEQDVLEYLKIRGDNIVGIDGNHISTAFLYATVYGDIIEVDGKLCTTECDRTGCVFCLFGITQGKGENRIQRLQRTHPKLHRFCLDGLGIREVLKYIGVPCEIEAAKASVCA
jgi:3'-phosphoadenosine 5'-phosphosulfate sulfotransferase (PAPS reductase)/FAD synthetase